MPLVVSAVNALIARSIAQSLSVIAQANKSNLIFHDSPQIGRPGIYRAKNGELALSTVGLRDEEVFLLKQLFSDQFLIYPNQDAIYFETDVPTLIVPKELARRFSGVSSVGGSSRSSGSQSQSIAAQNAPSRMPSLLKNSPGNIPPFQGRSNLIISTSVPNSSDARSYYLRSPGKVLPPCISSSEFVPPVMIEHLMRKKKNAALGVKFVPGRTPPDQITDMEGAMHTYVTPIVKAALHGDYVYRGSHRVYRFIGKGNTQGAREVIVSALIQPDFEDTTVMLELAALGDDPVVGRILPADFSIPASTAKQDHNYRRMYDLQLREHMVWHLVEQSKLPSRRGVEADCILPEEIPSFLEAMITAPDISPTTAVQDRYAALENGSVVSLELLFWSAVHQVRNELSALECTCPQGYVYTCDPPSIFAREIGASILNRILFAALKHLSASNSFSRMLVYGFNDYADSTAVNLLGNALSKQSHLRVVPKRLLFSGKNGAYTPLPGTEAALLVVHNNSDAFGQNVETEYEGGSLHGAIGANSSTAASLVRNRSDLLSHLM